MSDFIEDFYFGNIEPQEISTEHSLELKKKLDLLTKTEEQLTSKLAEEEKALFMKYVGQSSEFLCISNSDSFTVGFRLGARFTYDTFINNRKG